MTALWTLNIQVHQKLFEIKKTEVVLSNPERTLLHKNHICRSSVDPETSYMMLMPDFREVATMLMWPEWTQHCRSLQMNVVAISSWVTADTRLGLRYWHHCCTRETNMKRPTILPINEPEVLWRDVSGCWRHVLGVYLQKKFPVYETGTHSKLIKKIYVQ